MSTSSTDYKAVLQKTIEVTFKDTGYQPTKAFFVFQCIFVVSEVALIIIASLGAAHILSARVLGGTTLILSGGLLVTELMSGHLKERKCELLMTFFTLAVFCSIAILGITGTLSCQQMGWAVIGFFALKIILDCGLTCLPSPKEFCSQVLEIAKKVETDLRSSAELTNNLQISYTQTT